MAMADQKLRPAAALGRGPLHDYMAQLLSSFEEVQLQLGESATVRRSELAMSSALQVFSRNQPWLIPLPSTSLFPFPGSAAVPS